MNATQLSLFDLLHTPPPEPAPPPIGELAYQKKREREARRAQKQKEVER